ncbi:hypothetical protein [Pedobacter chitinilyticus]|uniref:Uncharacterized protein n=1 Tax=Pedobacter chitinilyticus TaxID=2233776 RepID=A0A3S3SS76_9SPHI|nr:hypothetical protein [Pedobacter chitinilyticus]RWU08152.1 hypothetical protein DPV69_07160 [Pedobacter chitinilyticus]
MPRITIDKKIVIKYDHRARDKYWKALSTRLSDKHGKGPHTDSAKVEEMLLEAFNFLVGAFRELIGKENRYTFFLYVHWLHEQSIEIHLATLNKLKLENITESEFALYRRILKLILEQGCDKDFPATAQINGRDVLAMDELIQELLYIATWIYNFADMVALQKMIEDCHSIEFEADGMLAVGWQYHYGGAYKILFPLVSSEYVAAALDTEAIKEFREKIEECFQTEYDFAGGIIWEIQKHHSPNAPNFQTVERAVLPLNLIENYGMAAELAEAFYDGLSISRDNKLSIEDAVLKPHSLQRYMFRPILVYNINGERRALVGKQKWIESIMVLSTNAIHWNAMFPEWFKLRVMRDFLNKKGHEHDRILEDRIEKIVKDKRFYYTRNIKSFKRPGMNNLKIDNELAGEIDLIVVNPVLRIVYVADAKYNRARYEPVGYRTDYTNFLKSYEKQLKRKVDWIAANLVILQEHLKIINGKNDIDLTGYQVQGIFIINTPTFYMFNGDFWAITLGRFATFLDGKLPLPELHLSDEKTGKVQIVKHPYFRKPVQS